MGRMSANDQSGNRASLSLRERGARKLRKTSTQAERCLWWRLRGRRLAGYKFRRQVIIEPYIVDFVCLEAKLAREARYKENNRNTPVFKG